MKHEGRIRVNAIDWLSLVLVIVGALVWGLVGAGYFLDMNLNIVAIIFADFPAVENLIYLVVGLAGLYELYFAYQLYTARPSRSGTAEGPM